MIHRQMTRQTDGRTQTHIEMTFPLCVKQKGKNTKSVNIKQSHY